MIFKVVENTGATLWNPLEIIEANGGFPPLTYAQFCHIAKAVGRPDRPRPDVDLSSVELIDLSTSENLISEKLTLFPTTPSPEMVGIERDPEWKEKFQQLYAKLGPMPPGIGGDPVMTRSMQPQ